MAPTLLLAATACQGKSTPVEVISIPSVAPPPSDTATAPFQGAIPVAFPVERAGRTGDVDSSANAAKKLVSGGEEFVHGLYERPFNADTMDKYFPFLDIVDFQGFMDDTWGYAAITVAGADPNGGLPAQYGLELDLDRDGRGDWLIRASNPTRTQWSTQGVQAWNDADADIGGVEIMTADGTLYIGNGYEALVFDQGNGTLTDGAWVRVEPNNPDTVEIAFKLSMVGSPSSYAMGAWAGTNVDPAMFDHNDAMTHAQAGSPLPDYAMYPLKALAEIDNTCRLAIGFAPTVKEPGLCATAEKEAQEAEGGDSGCPGEVCYLVGDQEICRCPN